MPYSVENFSNGSVPKIVHTCPGSIKAFKLVSPELIKKSIAGGINLWHETIEKFSGGFFNNSDAVAGAVVSKPADMNTTSLSIFSAISTAFGIP